MKHLLTLLCGIAACYATAAGNPRLFVHQHTPYGDMKRLDRELDLAVELGFGGVRTEWGAKEMVGRDNNGASNWAKETVMLPFLKEIKKRGLRLHITFGAPKAGATLQQEMSFYRYVMTTSASMLGPDEVSWTVANEPKAWEKRTNDPYLIARADALIRFWDESKLHEKGYWLYAPTMHGWQHWSENPVVMREEIDKGLGYLSWIYGQPEYRSFLRKLASAYHVYAPPSGYDAGFYAREKASSIAALVGNFVSHPKAITEFNVRYSPRVSMLEHGRRCADMAKELLMMSSLKFVTVYCLAGHKEMDFISAEGQRNTERIKGFKEGLTRR